MGYPVSWRMGRASGLWDKQDLELEEFDPAEQWGEGDAEDYNSTLAIDSVPKLLNSPRNTSGP